MDKNIEARNIPRRYCELYKRAMKGRSREAAMRMFCLECVGYIANEVRLCTDKGCPLYPFRVLAGVFMITPDVPRRVNAKKSTKSLF